MTNRELRERIEQTRKEIRRAKTPYLKQVYREQLWRYETEQRRRKKR